MTASDDVCNVFTAFLASRLGPLQVGGLHLLLCLQKTGHAAQARRKTSQIPCPPAGKQGIECAGGPGKTIEAGCDELPVGPDEVVFATAIVPVVSACLLTLVRCA